MLFRSVSDFNQRAYELFARPLVQAVSSDYTAQLLRAFHPLRFQNWAISSLNPWLSWVAPAAQAVRQDRQAVAADDPARRAEKLGAELMSASLDLYRDLRDAATEAQFFTLYANLAALQPGDADPGGVTQGTTAVRDLPEVRQALARIGQGGFVEALARVAFLTARDNGEPLPLSRLELRRDLAADYAADLPDLTPHQWRTVRGVQEIIARVEPEQAVSTLPALLADPADRQRLLKLLDKVTTDRRVLETGPSAEQAAMVDRIRTVLADKARPARRTPARKKAR